jgi:drug/metabolite transporter (DMT)-like permease
VPLVLLAVPEASTPIDWSPTLLLAVLYSGLLATAFGYWAQQTAVRSLGPMATGVGSLSVPVIGVTVGAIVLGERVTPTEVLGLVVTMAGVVVVLFGSRAAGRVRARRSASG